MRTLGRFLSFWLPLAAFSENLDPIIFRLEPAFVENVGQAPQGYTHALNPGGWLFNCQGLTSARLRLEIAGASAACASATDHTGVSERFYPSGRTAPRSSTLRYLQVLPGVDAEYSMAGDFLELAFLSSDPAKLSAIALKSTGEFPWDPPAPIDQPGKRIYRFDGFQVFRPVFGSGPVEVDQHGNWYFLNMESTWSAMAPDSATCLRGLSPYPCPDVTLLSFSAEGNLRFMTHLGGRRYDAATATALDAEGNLYVAGTTYSADFPVTDGPLQPGYAGPEEMRQESRVYPGGDIFVAKLDGASGALVYSKLLGSPLPDSATNISVDSSGAAYVSIHTRSREFPSSPNAPFPPACIQTPLNSQSCSWLASLNPSGSKLTYSTPIPALYPPVSVSPGGIAAVAGEASQQGIPVHLISPEGSLIPGGTRLPADFLRTLRWAPDGALWTTGARTSGPQPEQAIFARIDPDRSTTHLIPVPTPPEDLAVHPDGSLSVVVQGAFVGLSNPWLPGPGALLPKPCKASSLLARLDPNGNFLRSTFIPGSSHSFVAATEGVLFWQDHSPNTGVPNSLSRLDGPDSGVPSVLARLDWNAPPGLRLLCAYNPGHPSSELITSGGAIIELRGPGIGVSVPVEMPRGPDGRLPDEYQGNRVTIAGQPARIVAAAQGSLTVILPQSLKSAREQLIVSRDGHAAGVLDVIAVPTSPLAVSEILGLRPTNEDGSPNSIDSPAPAGSLVTVHLAGAGPFNPPLPDGEIEHATLSAPSTALAAQMVSRPCEILSARQAQGLPTGLVEVRARLPLFSDLNPGVYAFDLVVGPAPEPWFFSSARYTIFFRAPTPAN